MRNTISPMLDLWLKDAAAMEMSEDMQKGMLFCIGYSLGFNTRQCDLETIRAVICQLSPDALSGERKFGDRFDETRLRGVLIEMMLKVDRDFSPRVLHTKPDGTELKCFDPVEATSCLPDIDPENISGAGWDHFMTRLYPQIGVELNLDPEEAYLAGIERSAIYAKLDLDNAYRIAKYLDQMRAPHFKWLGNLPYLPERFIEPALEDTLMHKILHAKQMDGGGQYEMAQQLSYRVFQHMEISRVTLSPGGPMFGALSLQGRLFVASLIKLQISTTFSDQISAQERDQLLEIGHRPPPVAADIHEALAWMLEGIETRYGYHCDRIEQMEGWQCCYRACAFVFFAVACLLNPGWNRACIDRSEVSSVGDGGDSHPGL